MSAKYNYRDSETGEYITKREYEQADQRTVERERRK